MPAAETGFCVSCAVAPSPGKGLGVFTRESIARGRIVWRHNRGAFTLYDEAAFKTLIADMSDDQIVFELTHVHTFEEFPGCLIRALDDGIRINHSSDPNLATNKPEPAAPILDPTAADYLPQVALALADDRYSLIALRDINAGEELVNDYNEDAEGPAFFDALCDHYNVTEDYLGAV